jgi:hypothetical protein
MPATTVSVRGSAGRTTGGRRTSRWSATTKCATARSRSGSALAEISRVVAARSRDLGFAEVPQ